MSDRDQDPKRFVVPIRAPESPPLATLAEASDFIVGRIVNGDRALPEWRRAGALLVTATNSPTPSNTELLRQAVLRALMEESLGD